MNSTGVEPQTLKSLQRLAQTKCVKQYYLAGGTALTLYLSHRVSYDLDFFSQSPVSPQEIIRELQPIGKLELFQNESGTFNGVFNSTKLSLFEYPYEPLESPIVFNGVQIASLNDILTMKLEAVASRGVKRDFIDLYFLLQQTSLDSAIKLFERKFSEQNVSTAHLLKSLMYFVDADPEPHPNMLIATDWDDVKLFFKSEVARLANKIL